MVVYNKIAYITHAYNVYLELVVTFWVVSSQPSFCVAPESLYSSNACTVKNRVLRNTLFLTVQQVPAYW